MGKEDEKKLSLEEDLAALKDAIDGLEREFQELFVAYNENDREEVLGRVLKGWAILRQKLALIESFDEHRGATNLEYVLGQEVSVGEGDTQGLKKIVEELELQLKIISQKTTAGTKSENARIKQELTKLEKIIETMNPLENQVH